MPAFSALRTKLSLVVYKNYTSVPSQRLGVTASYCSPEVWAYMHVAVMFICCPSVAFVFDLG